MISIRRRLTIRLLLTVGLVTGGVAAGLYIGVRAALTREFDAVLEAKAVSIESAARWDGNRVDLDFDPAIMPWYRPGHHAEYFVVRDVQEGRSPSQPIARSPSLPADKVSLMPAIDEGELDLILPDGRNGRAISRTFKPSPDEELDKPGREQDRADALKTAPLISVSVAMSRKALDSTLATIGVSLGIAGAVLGLAMVFGVRYALSSGLAPLKEFSRVIGQIQPEALSHRVSDHGIPDELRLVRTRLNELIERLEMAFQRERTFASAAAHELRTPVAELRSLLEVATSRPRDAEQSREAMTEALGITLRLNRLISVLLALARPSRASAGLSPIFLQPLLEQIVGRFHNQIAERAGSVHIASSQPVSVLADPAALESILGNILSNAVDYSEPEPVIVCEIRRMNVSTIRVELTNPVNACMANDLEHFFEPFWRRDAARRNNERFGLGLTVARSLARSMGGDLTAELSENRLRLCLDLHAAP